MKFRSIAALAAVSGLSACVVAPVPGYAPIPSYETVVVPDVRPVPLPPPPPLVPVVPVVPVLPPPVVEPIVTDGIWLPPAVVITEDHGWRAPGHPFGPRPEGRGWDRGRGGPGPEHPPMH
jgi:hypothetical protein